MISEDNCFLRFGRRGLVHVSAEGGKRGFGILVRTRIEREPGRALGFARLCRRCDSVIRAFFTILIIIFLTLLLGGGGLIFFLIDRSGTVFKWFARIWSRLLLLTTGSRFQAEGAEKLEKGRSYLFVANHQSLFDIPAAFAALPFKVVMTPKKELFRIPIFGWAIRAGGFILIDRSRPEAARASLAKAAKKLRGTGKCILMFPEGTRSKDGKVGVFKEGAYHTARDLGVALVPVSIQGTRDIIAKGSLRFRSGHVRVKVGTPIDPRGDTGRDRAAVMQELREQVIQGLCDLGGDRAQLEG